MARTRTTRCKKHVWYFDQPDLRRSAFPFRHQMIVLPAHRNLRGRTECIRADVPIELARGPTDRRRILWHCQDLLGDEAPARSRFPSSVSRPILSMQRVAHNELGFGRNISRYSNRAEFSHLILGHLDRARIPVRQRFQVRQQLCLGFHLVVFGNVSEARISLPPKSAGPRALAAQSSCATHQVQSRASTVGRCRSAGNTVAAPDATTQRHGTTRRDNRVVCPVEKQQRTRRVAGRDFCGTTNRVGVCSRAGVPWRAGCDWRAGPIDRDKLLRNILRRALRRAGLPPLRFHDMRH